MYFVSGQSHPHKKDDGRPLTWGETFRLCGYAIGILIGFVIVAILEGFAIQ